MTVTTTPKKPTTTMMAPSVNAKSLPNHHPPNHHPPNHHPQPLSNSQGVPMSPLRNSDLSPPLTAQASYMSERERELERDVERLQDELNLDRNAFADQLAEALQKQQ
eukprot:CAMPEP_0175045694 /NCGR_PEP_ID=MMETSP0052_2-20121109/4590_1 /TAXON_ID=51329 ORGANISM="Polytomella parva, Strain SAG 63-3" /NCGR_SAMPLE_ID=MMETSP0052_2 /ASSEMBLY_ACC=CAM_ASM_000194 /LENGTH=106 /DNA_ID=CAMNT_0016309303 /DNA_START=57 /DNA_END=374 /DNA_ORIENTATION=+